LLGCWVAGLLGCWVAGLLGCWVAGLLGCWVADEMDSATQQLSNPFFLFIWPSLFELLN